MKILNGIAIAALMALLALASAPAYASCTGSPIISTIGSANESYIWTQDYFVPFYIGDSNYAPWMIPGNPPVTSAFTGLFWALGTGDPVDGLGDDNGTHAQDAWFLYNSIPASSLYYAGYVSTNWAEPGIDGCLDNSGASSSFDGDECTCILLSDQDGTDGYFAIASALVDAGHSTFFDMPGNDNNGNAAAIILRPIPKPFITNTLVDQSTEDIDLTVTVAPFSEGVYAKDGCDCGPIGFKVMSRTIPLGDPPPGDRDASLWTELELAGGGSQSVTPFGSSVTVESICGWANHDVFLATGLVFDSGFGPSVVSRNSTRIECGPNLANPFELRSRPEATRFTRDPGRREPVRTRGGSRTRNR